MCKKDVSHILKTFKLFLSSIDTFPCSLLNSAIKSSFVYERYIQRVVDLANIGQTEEAGQLLMTLVTEASNVLAGKSTMSTTMYNINNHTGRVKRIIVFEHSAMTNFSCACPAIQMG